MPRGQAGENLGAQSGSPKTSRNLNRSHEPEFKHQTRLQRRGRTPRNNNLTHTHCFFSLFFFFFFFFFFLFFFLFFFFC